MNVFRMVWLGVTASIGLSGCMIVVPLQATPSQQHQTQVRNILLGGSSYSSESDEGTPPTNPPVVNSNATTTRCGLFKPPSRNPMPAMVDLNDPDVDTAELVNELLGNYIIDLREYIDHEWDKWDAEYRDYLDRCR